MPDPVDDLLMKLATPVLIGIGRLLRLFTDFIIYLIRMAIFTIIYQIRNRPRRIPGLPLESRFEHAHVIGGSGHGKTQLLQQLILRDIYKLKEGHGSIIVIDSQSDIINKILRLAEMRQLYDRLILIDPSDIKHPPALNLFDFGLNRLNKLRPVDREKLLLLCQIST